jgi:L-2,4-diaminobutyrate decarboxylase
MVQLNVLLADSQQQASTNEASSMLNSMFNKENIDNFKIGLEQVMQLLEQTIATQQKPFSGILPQELAKKFIGIDLNQPLFDIPDALEEVAQLYLKDAVYFNNPRYLAHLNCPIVYQSILAELLATSINTAVETWDQSGGATFIEQSIVDWTLSKLALGEQADGVFTSGGTQSNLMAMLLARDFQCQLYATLGD